MISAVAGMFSSKRKMSASKSGYRCRTPGVGEDGTMALEEGLTAAALHYLLLRAIAGQRQLQNK
jgi:hypothetical protein